MGPCSAAVGLASTSCVGLRVGATVVESTRYNVRTFARTRRQSHSGRVGAEADMARSPGGIPGVLQPTVERWLGSRFPLPRTGKYLHRRPDHGLATTDTDADTRTGLEPNWNWTATCPIEQISLSTHSFSQLSTPNTTGCRGLRPAH